MVLYKFSIIIIIIIIAPIVSISTTKCSDVDHTELPANTPHLPKYPEKFQRDNIAALFSLFESSLSLPAKINFFALI